MPINVSVYSGRQIQRQTGRFDTAGGTGSSIDSRIINQESAMVDQIQELGSGMVGQAESATVKADQV